MGSLITIDRGNSTTKVTAFEGDELVASKRFETLTVEDVADMLSRYQGAAVAYCAVAHIDARFVESVRRISEEPLFLFSHATPLPIEIAYASPSTLGLDRICAAVGASVVAPGETSLVVDAGTAVTLDILAEGSRFEGGNISPGMSLRFNALHQWAPALPLCHGYEAPSPLPQFGSDTRSAIECGVLGGLRAEIMQAADDASRRGASRLILTGGDADLLASLLAGSPLPITKSSTLVAIGLKRIYEYNEGK